MLGQSLSAWLGISIADRIVCWELKIMFCQHRQEWNSNSRVVGGKWKWLWKFMNAISVEQKLIKCNNVMNAIASNNQFCNYKKKKKACKTTRLGTEKPSQRTNLKYYFLCITVYRLVHWGVSFTYGIVVWLCVVVCCSWQKTLFWLFYQCWFYLPVLMIELGLFAWSFNMV